MYCKKCGSEIHDEAVICVKCGCATKDDFYLNQQPKAKKKINVLCLLGFIFSIVSFFISLFGLMAVAGLTLSIIGFVQANKRNEGLKGLGIAGIAIAGCSILCFLYYYLVIYLALI